MRLASKLAAISLAIPLAIVGSAWAKEFTPTMSFGLNPAKVNANPELAIKVEQDAGEQELGHVILQVPKGFRLTGDAKIEDGTQLGAADLAIDAGPGCAGGAGTAPATFPDRQIVERDRTDEEADRGVKAVWVVDLRPVTTIPLEVTGSPRAGWKLEGDIPSNPFTCPPLLFDGLIFAKTDGGVPIVKNPRKPGRYVFSGTFFSQESPAKKTIRQTLKIKR